ncbi:MAG: ATP-binding cassette domain-containing protein [Lachnospiraceae bacterium]|nr:ATP-binding cassette domain-containing protein [Lachnospiraceae bacterium]
MSRKNRFTQILKYVFVLFFWIIIWYFLSLNINNSIFLPTPKDTFGAFINICRNEEFFVIVFNSFFRIVKGFLGAVILGFILSVVSFFVEFIEILITPVMKLVKTIPVASFVILALLWIDSSNLSVLISFMMVLPIVYINLFTAFKGVNKRLLEISKVFEVSIYRRIRFIYVPQVFPAFISACKIGLGFAFKAGIAAEIIGLPVKSIGWELYQSKLYLMTEEMFAWTIIIVLISIFFEVLCIYLLTKLSELVMKVNVKANKVSKKQCSDVDKVKDENYKIRLENVSKSYGKKLVLNNINVNIDNSRVIGIMGESGVGKTTLIRIMLGLIKNYSGNISIRNKENNEVIRYPLKKAVVFQEDRLIENADVYTNIYAILGDTLNKVQIDKHLKELGLEGLGEKKVSEFSGGMKRRVEIMRAILSNADIYILDEAFKGLDDKNRDMAIEYVKKYTTGKILIVISHDMDECEKFNAKVVNLNEG